MAFQPVEDALGVVVKGSIGSIPFINTYGVTFTGTFDETVADTVASVFVGFYENFNGAQSDTFGVQTIEVTDLRTETGGQFEINGTPDLVTGEDAGQPLPFQVAALISWGTGTRGRSFRGRSYIGGFVESGSNGRSIDAATVTELQDFVNDVVANGQIGVISRFHGVDDEGVPIKRASGIITPITTGLVHTTWRTQRRRALAND